MLFDWLGSHAIELLWMLTVLGATGILALVLVGGLAALTSALSPLAAALTESARTREEQAQRRDMRRAMFREEHWRIRHHHTHPQCAMCKLEAERRTRDAAQRAHDEEQRRMEDADLGIAARRPR